MSEHDSQWLRLSGAVVLDALNTVGGPLGDRIENELVATPGALEHWARQGELLTAADLTALQCGLQVDGAAALARFHRFRAALFEVFDATLAERAVSPEALYVLADAIASAKGASGLYQAGGRLAWRLHPADVDPDRLTAALALEADRFMAGPDLARLRRCKRCSWMFLAPVRGRPRIWCSMALCGNRDKQARHAARARAES
jgi:predicted RNA-binding Zn ribbon-like protein